MDFLGGEDEIVNDGTLTINAGTAFTNLETFIQTAASATLTIQIDLDSAPTSPIVDFGGAELIASTMMAIRIEYAGDWQPSLGESFTLFEDVTFLNGSTDGFVVTQSVPPYIRTLSADADQGTLTITPAAINITARNLRRHNTTIIRRDTLAVIGPGVDVELDDAAQKSEFNPEPL